MITRPMKGATWKKGAAIPFPVLATPKIDGIRFLIRKGKAITAQFKPIPNIALREWMEAHLNEGLDGELKMPGAFNKTSSAVMSHEGNTKGLKFIVFDYVRGWDTTRAYSNRMRDLIALNNKYIEKLIPTVIHNERELAAYESKCLNAGHEGVMLRIPEGGYKSGRSSLRQFWLIKLIRSLSAEARIIGFKQLMSNQNEQITSETGRSKRSSKKEGKVAKAMVGSFIVKGINGEHKNKVFKCGGLTSSLRKDAWKHQDKYLGQTITYEYKPYGEKDLPRQPRFKAFRKGY